MSDAWDADDFEPETVTRTVKATDKWEGEDDDDVKDSWDAEDDSDNGSDSGAQKAVQRKKKKKLADIIAEKEAAKAAELEAKKKDQLAAKAANTPEAKLAEKLRLQKLDESSSLQLAKEMMGLSGGSSVDSLSPVSKDDFEKFERAISDKITMFSASDHYGPMLESLVPKVCLDLNASTIKSIKMNLEALYNTKLKDEKAAAQKAKKKGKGSSIKMDTQKDIFSGGGGGGGADYDDMDDFM